MTQASGLLGAAGDLRFDCTRCGGCCNDLKIPLTVSEAVDWLEAGREVQVICEAVPWPHEPPAEDLLAAHRRRRSFDALSGTLPVRVVVILAANIVGACPNLLPDRTCGIYAHRPLVCRIYPAEINPFVRLDPAGKVCPPEAWSEQHPLLLRNGMLVDAAVRRDIEQSRATDASETLSKRRVCETLHLDEAAVAEEGFVIHSPAPAALLPALLEARAHRAGGPLGQWRFISNQTRTLVELSALGAVAARAVAVAAGEPQYAGFRPDTPA